jgi:hypothetical protein
LITSEPGQREKILAALSKKGKEFLEGQTKREEVLGT